MSASGGGVGVKREREEHEPYHDEVAREATKLLQESLDAGEQWAIAAAAECTYLNALQESFKRLQEDYAHYHQVRAKAVQAQQAHHEASKIAAKACMDTLGDLASQVGQEKRKALNNEAAQATQAENETLKRKVAELQDDNLELERRLQQQNTKNARLQRQIEDLEAQVLESQRPNKRHKPAEEEIVISDSDNEDPESSADAGGSAAGGSAAGGSAAGGSAAGGPAGGDTTDEDDDDEEDSAAEKAKKAEKAEKAKAGSSAKAAEKAEEAGANADANIGGQSDDDYEAVCDDNGDDGNCRIVSFNTPFGVIPANWDYFINAKTDLRSTPKVQSDSGMPNASGLGTPESMPVKAANARKLRSKTKEHLDGFMEAVNDTQGAWSDLGFDLQVAVIMTLLCKIDSGFESLMKMIAHVWSKSRPQMPHHDCIKLAACCVMHSYVNVTKKVYHKRVNKMLSKWNPKTDTEHVCYVSMLELKPSNWMGNDVHGGFRVPVKASMSAFVKQQWGAQQTNMWCYALKTMPVSVHSSGTLWEVAQTNKMRKEDTLFAEHMKQLLDANGIALGSLPRGRGGAGGARAGQGDN